MSKTFLLKSIGWVKLLNNEKAIELDAEYFNGLTRIEGFSHLQIIWWAHLADKKQDRKTLVAEKLFKNAPDKLGIFGTRAPTRPNPIMISTIKVDRIDQDKGIIYTPFIDAEPDTPILDVKPYFPMERVKNCVVPDWFGHWPDWAEDAIRFNWQNEINFD